MLVEQVLHAVDGETCALCAGEQHVTTTPLRLTQPDFHHGESGFGDGGAAFFASLADDVDVSAGSEDEVVACEPSHLGYAQTRLDGYKEKGVIAPAKPGALIRSGQQGIDFRTREKLDQGPREALAGNREHPLDLCGVGWRLEGSVSKEGMERGEAQIPTADAQAVMLLQVIQKRHDQRGVDLLEVQP